MRTVTLLDQENEMDFMVTVRTYTGAVKSVEVKNMPDEAAARAEAVGLTFGQVLSIVRLDEPDGSETPIPRPRGRVQQVERELEPGETETIITGWNNNPLSVFSALNNDFELFFLNRSVMA